MPYPNPEFLAGLLQRAGSKLTQHEEPSQHQDAADNLKRCRFQEVHGHPLQSLLPIRQFEQPLAKRRTLQHLVAEIGQRRRVAVERRTAKKDAGDLGVDEVQVLADGLKRGRLRVVRRET